VGRTANSTRRAARATVASAPVTVHTIHHADARVGKPPEPPDGIHSMVPVSVAGCAPASIGIDQLRTTPLR
jgi:hypothetical protein